MTQSQRHKDCFYRTRAKAEQLKLDVARWKAVADVAAKELEAMNDVVLALKAEVERMKKEHQEEIYRRAVELAAERDRLDWLMDSSHWVQHWPFGPEQERWSAPGGDEGELFAATAREAIDRAIRAQS